MPIVADYLAKLASAFVDELAQAQRQTYDLLAPHSNHDLDVHLDTAYNVTYARCATCNTVLLDLEVNDVPSQSPAAPETNAPATQPDAD